MRKVFINVGAGSGSDIKGFIELDETHSEWEIFAFECNPVMIEKIKTDYPNINVCPYAASTRDEQTKLYLGNKYINSSLISAKVNVSENRFLQVETIDLSRWLLENFTSDDYIILTLDIEGMEYEVLNKMVNDSSLDLIDELYIEFHGKKIPHITEEYEKSWVDYLISRFDDKVYIYEYYYNEKFIELNKEALG